MSNHKLKNGQFLKITELYAFIAKDKNGHEGIMGIRNSKGEWMPLIGADVEMVEKLKPIADKMGAQYELRYFVSRGDVALSLYNRN